MSLLNAPVLTIAELSMAAAILDQPLIKKYLLSLMAPIAQEILLSDQEDQALDQFHRKVEAAKASLATLNQLYTIEVSQPASAEADNQL